MLGPIGPPHVENQAIAVHDRGIDVVVGGDTPADLEDTAIEDAGIPVRLAPEVRRRSPLGMATTVRWVRALIRTERPDVVHAHWLPGYGFAAAAAAASPLALTAWGSDVYQAGRFMRIADRLALRRADLVMGDSQDLLERCIAMGAEERKTEVVQWGVDLTVFRPSEGGREAAKRALGLGPGPLILSPRSLAPVYNIPAILDAFELIGARRPDAHLVLKHMGAVRIDLPELPHPERVSVVGKIAYEEMALYYQAADVCISLPSSDSSPRSVWEAMGCGCPCVLSDLPWVEELVKPHRAALSIPIDADAAAEAVLRLLDEPELGEGLSQRGRDLVERHLDRDREMDRLVDNYARLAHRGEAA